MPRARAVKRARRETKTGTDSTNATASSAQPKASSSSRPDATSNKDCKALNLPSEILLEILSYFEPVVSMDKGEKAMNNLDPQYDDTTTTPANGTADAENNDDDAEAHAEENANNDHNNDQNNNDESNILADIFGDSDEEGDNSNDNGINDVTDTNNTPFFQPYTYVYNELRFLPGKAFERTDVLRALSQTCVAWRNFFWPMAWENVELGSALRNGRGAWYRKLADGFIRKARGIIGDEEVAKRVKRIRVVLTRCDIRTVLPLLTSCLAACTNLKTINVYFTHSEITTPLRDAFNGFEFPSVETVVLPTQAHHILRCCPNAKKVVCNDGDASQLISAVRARCKGVEVFEGLRPSWRRGDAIVKRVASAMPKLKEIRFEGCIVDDAQLQLLSPCKDLRLVQVVPPVSEMEGIEERMSSTIKILRNVMRPKNAQDSQQPAAQSSGSGEGEKGKGKAKPARTSQRSQPARGKGKDTQGGEKAKENIKGKCCIIIRHSNPTVRRWYKWGDTSKAVDEWTKTIYV